jgi:hypothetical protein
MTEPPSPKFTVHSLKTDPDEWVDFFIFDNMFFEDLQDWCKGKAASGPRLLAALQAVPSKASMSFWQAMAEAAWSRRSPDRGGSTDYEHFIETEAADIAFFQAVLQRLSRTEQSHDWLQSVPPPWVNQLRRRTVIGGPEHRATIEAGNHEWQLQSATALLLLIEHERRASKDMNDSSRLNLFQDYVTSCKQEAGGVAVFESILMLLKLFSPLDNRQKRGEGRPRDILTLKTSDQTDPGSAVKKSLNAARDLAMLRHLHDARTACGPYSGTPMRTCALLTADKHLAAYYKYVPAPTDIANDQILYDFNQTLQRFDIEDQTRSELTNILSAVNLRTGSRTTQKSDTAVEANPAMLEQMRVVAARLYG